MRSIIMVAVMFGVLVVVGGCATFQNPGPTEILVDGCKTAIDSYCKDVTPGEERVLACLYAHSDKLSVRCTYAFSEVLFQIQQCFDRNKDNVSERCKQSERTTI